MIISIDAEKNCWQNSAVYNKDSIESEHRGNTPQHNKDHIYDKPTANIILSDEQLKAFI